MSLEDDRLETENGFWLAGMDSFRAYLTKQVMLEAAAIPGEQRSACRRAGFVDLPPKR